MPETDKLTVRGWAVKYLKHDGEWSLTGTYWTEQEAKSLAARFAESAEARVVPVQISEVSEEDVG